MNKKLTRALIAAGLLSLMTMSQSNAADRVILNSNMELSGKDISNIETANITGGGGAVQNNGYVLSIIDGTVSGNKLTNDTGTAVFGGAIWQTDGTLNIKDGVTFSSNSVSSDSQTYPGWDGMDSPAGGAIYHRYKCCIKC